MNEPLNPANLSPTGGATVLNGISSESWKVTWRDKIRWKLFPGKHVDVPDELMVSHKDMLVMRTTVCLSFVDRVKLLFTGKLAVQHKVVTENIIGHHISFSTVNVLPPKFLERE